MQVILNRALKPIKNGWSAQAATVGIAAHGFSADIADRNLAYAVRLFLQPFERNGVLEQEGAAMRIELIGEGDIEVVLRD